MSDSLDPMDCSLPGSSVHGILQARILEWAAISFSRRSFQPKDQIWVSCIAGKFCTISAMRDAPYISWIVSKKKNLDFIDVTWKMHPAVLCGNAATTSEAEYFPHIYRSFIFFVFCCELPVYGLYLFSVCIFLMILKEFFTHKQE